MGLHGHTALWILVKITAWEYTCSMWTCKRQCSARQANWNMARTCDGSSWWIAFYIFYCTQTRAWLASISRDHVDPFQTVSSMLLQVALLLNPVSPCHTPVPRKTLWQCWELVEWRAGMKLFQLLSLSLSFSFFFPFSLSLSMFLAMSGCPSVSRSVCFTIIYFDAPAHVKKHEETCDNCALRHPRAESCVLPKPAKCKPSPSVIAFLGVWQSESSIKQRNHNRA